MSYRDTTEMCASGGWRWIGDIIETAGLPLEILHIINGRVYQIDAFDYEEGQEKPIRTNLALQAQTSENFRLAANH
jgi:hypothetical protein